MHENHILEILVCQIIECFGNTDYNDQIQILTAVPSSLKNEPFLYLSVACAPTHHSLEKSQHDSMSYLPSPRNQEEQNCSEKT